MKRIEELRKRALENRIYPLVFHYHFYKAFDRLSCASEDERYREAYSEAFEKLPVSISEGELIVGKMDIPLTDSEESEWKNKYRKIAESYACQMGQDSHMAVDYEKLLKRGIYGIIEDIKALIKTYENAREFYLNCICCLKAVLVHAEKYAEKALALSADETDEARKSELLEIHRILRRVPAYPAESFYEAVQAVHFLTHCLTLNPQRLNHQQFQLGRIDRFLLPYYEKDMREGRITKEFARELLDSLAIQINMRVPNGLSSGYMLGGRDENGNIIANDLTEMGLQVIEDIRLVYPSVGLCYTKGFPDAILEKACRLLLNGHSHPAIFNDDVISKGLIHYGVSEKESRNYIHSTCVEITPVAASNVWVASPYTNMPQLLLDAMDREYDSADDLINAVLCLLDRKIKRNFESETASRKIRMEKSQNPLLSCFVADCLEAGKDIEKGGARYNWIMPSFVGMANLVDSLYAVKTLVFDEKRFTLVEYKKLLDNNFEGNEKLRLNILNKIPKYGNDSDEIDSLFSLFTEHIIEECRKYTGPFSNANLIPSVFCWVMHEQFGRKTQATPDGRKAGFPLGDGSGPCQGREKNGPTASILSSTKWEHEKMIGGVAVNLKFSKSSLGPASIQTMLALIKTYLSRGGFEIQINVIDNETLKKAQLSPEEYADLVVRIGGYSDYFVKLSPEMQEELILRTAHSV
ncbi:MAG: hypothetical protein IJC48_01315 [Clostridia bacterium]|nr:hypothetical protein [Clostridia bacterium]